MKTTIQWFLFLILLSTLTIIFFKYFYENTQAIQNKPVTFPDKEKLELENLNSNLLYNLTFNKIDLSGNEYLIEAKEGKIKNDKSNDILMSDVVATIKLTNNETMIIKASNSVFNSQSFNSVFYDGVNMTYLEHKLTGEKLELFFDKNLIVFQNKVAYNFYNNSLFADKIIMNILTKDIKILSKDKNNRIKITKNN